MPYRINGIGTGLYGKDFQIKTEEGDSFDATEYFSFLFVPLFVLKDIHVSGHKSKWIIAGRESKYRAIPLKPYSNRRKRLYFWPLFIIALIIGISVMPIVGIPAVIGLIIYKNSLHKEYNREKPIQLYIRKKIYPYLGMYTDPAMWQRKFLDSLASYVVKTLGIPINSIHDDHEWNSWALRYLENGDYGLACLLSRIALGFRPNVESEKILLELLKRDAAYSIDSPSYNSPDLLNVSSDTSDSATYSRVSEEHKISKFEEAEIPAENTFTWVNSPETFRGQRKRNETEKLYRLLKSSFNPDLVSDPTLRIIYSEISKRIYDDFKSMEAEKFIVKYSGQFDFLESAIQIALEFQKSGLNDLAIELYRKILQLNPTKTQVINNLALLYIKKRDLQNAKSLLEKALTFEPANKTVMWNLALVYRENGETLKAKDLLEKLQIIETEPQKRTKIKKLLQELGL